MRNIKDHIKTIHEANCEVVILYISICCDIDLPGDGGGFLGTRGGVGGGPEDVDGVPEDGHGEHGGVYYKPPVHPLRLFLLPAEDSMYFPHVTI